MLSRASYRSSCSSCNGKAYRTDAETLSVLRSIVPAAKQANDMSAVIAVMTLGEAAGRIVCEGIA
jgi:hypothetical protein